MSDQYIQITSILDLADIELSASEVHGLIVGSLANHLKTGQAPNLLKLLVPKATGTESQYAPVNEGLAEIYRETSDILFEAKDGYSLLMPDDDAPLDVRVDALTDWTKGYLTGLLHNNLFGIDQITESGAEILRDFIQISEAEADELDNDDDNEKALVELEEYVKVGSQLVFEFIYSEQEQAQKT